MSLWDDDRHVNMLRHLAAKGRSQSAIAKALSATFPGVRFTKGAVNSKLSRLALSTGNPAGGSRRNVTALAKKRPKPARVAPVECAGRNAVFEVGETPHPSATVKPSNEAPGACTLLTLGAHMCKWPIGDPSLDNFTFCGEAAPDGPYCVRHHALAHQPSTPSKRAAGPLQARAAARFGA